MHETPENYGPGPLPPGHGGTPPGAPQHPYSDQAAQAEPPYGGQGQYPGQPPNPGQDPYGGQGQPPYPGYGPSHPGQDPYGSQGQPPYPGQDPYSGQPPYPGQDPYGAPPPGGAWGQGGGFGQPPGPGWGPPPPGPPKKNSGPIVVMAILGVLVLLGGGGAIVWALNAKDKPKHTSVAASSVPALPPEPSFPSTLPTPGDSPPLPNPTSTDQDQSMFVQAGDCVRIAGKAPRLRMLRVGCGKAPYKVLKRFSGTSDQKKCRNVPGFTTVFYARNTRSSILSYVLCLKRL